MNEVDIDTLCERHEVDRAWVEICIRKGRDVSETTMDYDGLEIPFLVIGTTPDEEEQMVDALAKYIWDNRDEVAEILDRTEGAE